MSKIDMNSSSEDDGDYTTTNVTLGYASTEPTGDDISHIGGHPTWLNKAHAPSAALSKCKACNGLTSLLLQLNADLQQHFSQDDRRLHVFCCRRKACSKVAGSIRAFREVSKPQKRKKEAPRQDLGSALFGAPGPNVRGNKANPFSLGNGSQSQPINPFSSLAPVSALAPETLVGTSRDSEPPTATFADKLKISVSASRTDEQTQDDSWPDESTFPSPFPQYYLDADAEQLDPEGLPKVQPPGTSGTKYDLDDSSGNATDKDTFESSLDKTFQKFSDRVGQNPEQVLRYEYDGQPLLYSGADAVASRFVTPHGKTGPARGMPRCESCGARRVFEMQLVPGLIFELEKDEPMDLDDGMEWGTIIVGTCASNCGDAGQVSFREEWVGVQWEERLPKK
ncbi:hypothetical protein DV736_g4714, partial [Chaetothyriales sp. CBS 134916]